MNPIMREYKPTVPEVVSAVRALYASPGGGAGCCLHVVLEDGNVENHSVEFSIEWAERHGHGSCAALARALRSMSKTQREKLSRMGKGD
jgi:hypothetical protein